MYLIGTVFWLSEKAREAEIEIGLSGHHLWHLYQATIMFGFLLGGVS
jgi:hypothetical protein